MLASMALSALDANAVIAQRGVFNVEQADGTQLAVRLIGDEHFHYYVTEDGIPLTTENNQYYYATTSASGEFVSSNVLARNAIERSSAELKMLSTIDNLLTVKALTKSSKRARRSIPQSGLGLFSSSFPVKGKIKTLVILVEYSDVSFDTTLYSTDAKAYFTDMLNKDGFSELNATGSCHEYFVTASKGQFDPQFDVIGPITLPQKRSYYGTNDNWGYDKYAEEMLVDAAKIVDDDVDFSQYDLDGDGYVDNVFIFYAGRGEASGGGSATVWPHAWTLEEAGKVVTCDGVKISRYACTNELLNRKTPDGIGTFTHEFSHVMGLPDLYNTEEDYIYYTPCEWSVMDYGPYNNNSRTPPTYAAYERNALQWIDPIVLDGSEKNVTLENILDSNTACLIPTSKNTEFFLLENRQKKSWDTYLPGHGMLVWHIDYNENIWTNNVVNNTESHQYVDIVEANNTTDGSSTTNLAGYTFPGTKGVTSFSATTTPALKSWAGDDLGINITEITESDSKISFWVNKSSSISSINVDSSYVGPITITDLAGRQVFSSAYSSYADATAGISNPGIYIVKTISSVNKIIIK